MNPRVTQELDPQQLLNHLDDLQAEVQRLRHALQHQERLATLGTVAGLIAHEFNNILTPVISYAQLASANPADQELAGKAVRKCLHGAERASQIATAILGFVRDDSLDLRTPARGQSAGRDPKAPAPRCGVAAALQEAMTCLGRAPQRDGITFTSSIPDDLQASMRLVALQHVFLNLILNARNAMIPGGGRLSVMAYAADTPPTIPDDAATSAGEGSTWNTDAKHAAATRPGWVVIEIADTGRGMTAEQLGRIFDPFYTLGGPLQPEPAATDRRRGGSTDVAPMQNRRGTGLGMTICTRLLEDADGWMTVRSAAGKGTTIQVVMPRA